MDKNELIKTIEDAFDGVVLGDGTSVEQTVVIDNYGEGFTEEDFEELKTVENTEDWKALDVDTLDKIMLSHIDAEGFRFYIPALMVNIINHYKERDLDWFVCTTMCTLLPVDENGYLNSFTMKKYKLLNEEQKHAIALFLSWIYRVETEFSYTGEAIQALERFWKEYL